MDLLTAQCDRHSENIFIDRDGQLQYIDNDKSLGVVSSAASGTVLVSVFCIWLCGLCFFRLRNWQLKYNAA